MGLGDSSDSCAPRRSRPLSGPPTALFSSPSSASPALSSCFQGPCSVLKSWLGSIPLVPLVHAHDAHDALPLPSPPVTRPQLSGSLPGGNLNAPICLTCLFPRLGNVPSPANAARISVILYRSRSPFSMTVSRISDDARSTTSSSHSHQLVQSGSADDQVHFPMQKCSAGQTRRFS